MMPTIMTVEADSSRIHTPSVFEGWDNSSIGFQDMATTVANKISGPVEESAGMVRQIWNDLVDDIFGPKIQGPSRA